MAKIQWIDGLKLGRGINSTTGQKFQTAITFDPSTTDTEGSEGQKPTLTLATVSSSRQLMQQLDVDGSAALRVKMRGNISAEASFSQQQNLNSNYLYTLVKVEVTNPAQTIRKQVLTDDASKLLTSNGWEVFAKAYGPEYVESYITGGYYYALIEIQTANLTQQKEIRAKLSGSFRNFGVDTTAAATVKSQIKDALQDQSTNISVCRLGGKGSLQVNLDEMIEQAIKFPKDIEESPVPLFAITNTYQSLAPTIEGVPLSLANQASMLDKYGELYLRLKDYQSSLDSWLRQDLNEEEKEEVRESSYATDEQIDNLIVCAKNCSDDSTQCKSYKLPDNFKWLSVSKELQGWNKTASVTLQSRNFPTNPNEDCKYAAHKNFEATVKLTTLFLEDTLPEDLKAIGLGIFSRKQKKTLAISYGVYKQGTSILIEHSGTADTAQYITYAPYGPADEVYFKIKKKDNTVDMSFSSDGLSWKSVSTNNLTDCGFDSNDSYDVVFTGHCSSQSVSGKFYNLSIDKIP